MNFTQAISHCAVTTIKGISTLAIFSIGTMTSPKANAGDHLIRCQRSGSKFFNVKYEANAPTLTLGGTFILEWHDPRAVNRRVETYQWKKGYRWNLTEDNGDRWSYVDISKPRGFKMYNLDNETLVECTS